jgi:hypothetical protein
LDLNDGFNQVDGPPSIETADQCGLGYPDITEMVHHTDARCFVLSGAAGDHRPVRLMLGRPNQYLVWTGTNVSWNTHAVRLIAGARTHVEDKRWHFAVEGHVDDAQNAVAQREADTQED